MGDKKKILILAGGTGGHVMPALAVAKKLQQEGHSVHWLGTTQGIEARLVPLSNIPLSYIHISGIRRVSWLAKLYALGLIFNALLQSLSIMRKLKPDAVLSMGGYVSGPGGIAAWLLGIPLILHEQNAIPGWTNRFLARFAKKIMVAFPEAIKKMASQKVIEVGNPVRAEIVAIPSPATRFDSSTVPAVKILIIGGSQGASILNSLLPEALSLLEPEGLQVWHQTGKAGFELTKEAYAKHQITAKVTAFIEEMAEAYAWADIIICRAGALTIAEVSCVGLASILVPFPYAVDDHQTYNAKFLSEKNAAFLLPQTHLTAQSLQKHIVQLRDNPEQRLKMAMASRDLGKPLATEIVAKQCIEVSCGTT